VISNVKLFMAALALMGLFWATAAQALTGGKTRAAEKAGAVLFHDKGCAHCHGADGAGTSKAPSLAGLCNDKAWTPAKITDQILNGGQKMPPFRESVTDVEAADLVAYLRARHRPTPPPASSAPEAPGR